MPVPPGKTKVTLYLDAEVAEVVRREAKARRISQGAVLDEAMRSRVLVIDHHPLPATSPIGALPTGKDASRP